MRQAIDWAVWADFRARENRSHGTFTDNAARQVVASLLISTLKVVAVVTLGL